MSHVWVYCLLYCVYRPYCSILYERGKSKDWDLTQFSHTAHCRNRVYHLSIYSFVWHTKHYKINVFILFTFIDNNTNVRCRYISVNFIFTQKWHIFKLNSTQCRCWYFIYLYCAVSVRCFIKANNYIWNKNFQTTQYLQIP